MPSPRRNENDENVNNDDDIVDDRPAAVEDDAVAGHGDDADAELIVESDDAGDDANSDDVVNGDAADAAEAHPVEVPALEPIRIEVQGDVTIMRDISQIFRMWELTHVRHGFDPEPILKRYVSVRACLRTCSDVF